MALNADGKKPLKLINFQTYIEKNKIKEVKNNNIFGFSKKTFDEEGLWSPSIFGQIGSRERKIKFGYVTLPVPFINPVIYKMIMTSCESIRDIINEKKTFVLDNGKFIENEYGETGLLFLVKNKDSFKFADNCKKEKLAEANYLDNHKELVFIDRYQIMPPGGIRDMNTNNKNVKQYSAEINDYYIKLISLINQYDINKNSDIICGVFAKEIQKTLLSCYIWIRSKVQGKSGLTRGTLMKKTLDYCGRIIASEDPNIELGYVGLPWQTVLVLYEPFFCHYVFKEDKDNILKNEILKFLNLETSLEYKDLKNFNLIISKNPEVVPPELKQMLVQVAIEITKDKDLLIKRDPVVSRISYYSAMIEVLLYGRGAVVNPLTCVRQTLDFDGDQLAIIPVYTNQALLEAAKLNPRKSKTAWINPIDNSGHTFKLELDIVSTIYAATAKKKRL